VIENRPGAGGNIATEAVVKAAADGYTLLLTTSANAINATLYDKLNFDFVRDIAPVASIVRTIYVMVLHPSVPAKTVPEFIAYAKTATGMVNMASAGSGTPQHVAGELFKMMAGVSMIHVPYRGVAPALTDLIGGQSQASLPRWENVRKIKGKWAPEVMRTGPPGHIRGHRIQETAPSPCSPPRRRDSVPIGNGVADGANDAAVLPREIAAKVDGFLCAQPVRKLCAMTITKSEAQRIAHDYVKEMEAGAGLELVLLDQHTIERDFGWVFFYDSKRHVETGDFQDSIVGNAPIVVTKADGRVHVTGTAHPVEHYLKEFDRS
jgi:Tripartite tricarboxylate transporter family receptor/Immunity protein 35